MCEYAAFKSGRADGSLGRSCTLPRTTDCPGLTAQTSRRPPAAYAAAGAAAAATRRAAARTLGFTTTRCTRRSAVTPTCRGRCVHVGAGAAAAEPSRSSFRSTQMRNAAAPIHASRSSGCKRRVRAAAAPADAHPRLARPPPTRHPPTRAAVLATDYPWGPHDVSTPNLPFGGVAQPNIYALGGMFLPFGFPPYVYAIAYMAWYSQTYGRERMLTRFSYQVRAASVVRGAVRACSQSRCPLHQSNALHRCCTTALRARPTHTVCGRQKWRATSSLPDCARWRTTRPRSTGTGRRPRGVQASAVMAAGGGRERRSHW